jgi:hypothetical protein
MQLGWSQILACGGETLDVTAEQNVFAESERCKPPSTYRGDHFMSEPLMSSARRKVIPVVDDEKVIATTLAVILNQAGFDAHAFNGFQAVEVLDHLRARFTHNRCRHARNDGYRSSAHHPRKIAELQDTSLFWADCNRLIISNGPRARP